MGSNCRVAALFAKHPRGAAPCLTSVPACVTIRWQRRFCALVQHFGRFREESMDHVYPVTEVYGSSPESIDQAVRNAISAASTSIRNLEWFEVTEIRGHVNSDGSVGHFQVGVKLGFRLDRKDAD